MSTSYRYTLPVEQSEWRFDGHTDVTFTWEYDENRDGLLQLYSKGKQQQWDAADRIDWSQDLDPENPMELDDRVIMIYGSDIWKRMTEKERRQVRHHLQASQISQFMHGEQGALIATAKIVQTVPDLDAKFYAATQVMDEARHVEAYSRLLHDKFELAYPITHGLRALWGHAFRDDASPDGGAGLGALPAHSRPVEEPARRRGQRLCHAGRGAPCRVRPARLARLLPAAHRRRAQRARGIRRPGVLAHARPLQPAGGLAAARPADREMHPDTRQFGGDEAVPQPPVQAPRAARQGNRPVGGTGVESV